jgi:hypothetical protein
VVEKQVLDGLPLTRSISRTAQCPSAAQNAPGNLLSEQGAQGGMGSHVGAYGSVVVLPSAIQPLGSGPHEPQQPC